MADDYKIECPEFDQEKSWIEAEAKLMARGATSSHELHIAYLMGCADASRHYSEIIGNMSAAIQRLLKRASAIVKS